MHKKIKSIHIVGTCDSLIAHTRWVQVLNQLCHLESPYILTDVRISGLMAVSYHAEHTSTQFMAYIRHTVAGHCEDGKVTKLPKVQAS
jgi:hypothetical protein